MAKPAIYLDANAAQPLKSSVVKALAPLLGEMGEHSFAANPSSIHSHGRKAKRLVADAREKIALSISSSGLAGLGVDTEQLIFTSSGSEANQLAIRSILEPRFLRGEKPHWITTPVEHDSVLQMKSWVEARGGTVSLLPVDENGAPVVSALESMVRPETALVSAVWVNNETGVITKVAELSRAARLRGIALHLDGAQAWGKIPVDVSCADLVSFSGHKIGAPAGIGLLHVRPGQPVSPVLLGKQEKGRRGGTENLLGIVAMGAAAETLNPREWAESVLPLRDRFEAEVTSHILGARVNGAGASRVTNTSNFSFEGIEGEGLVMALDLGGYSVSSGSACSSGALEPSHVLLAMGRSRNEAMSAIRVSLAGPVDWDILNGFVMLLEETVAKMRRRSEESSVVRPYT